MLLAQSSPEVKPTPENSYTDVIDEESLASILEGSEAAKSIYENCQNTAGTGTVLECLKASWNDPSTSEETKKELAQALQNVRVTYENGRQVFKKENVTGLKLNPTAAKITNSNDPAVKKLREYLAQQLSDALYGEMNQQQGKMTHRKLVDHSTFYKLFESQVGQNIILALSDYCLNSKEVTVPPPAGAAGGGGDYKVFVVADEGTRTQVAESNLNDLKNGFLDTASAGLDSQKNRYKTCISRISQVCNPPLASWTQEGVDSDGNPTDPPVTSEHRNQACLVTEYLDRGRQALIDLGKIKETMKTASNTGGFISESPQDKFYQEGRSSDEKSIQELTIHTSKEVAASGMDQATQELVGKVEECINSGASEEECKNFLDTNLDDKNKLLAEEFFRAKAQEARLKEKLEEDEQAVLTYLKEEGYDEATAQRVIEEAGGNQQAIEKILARYSEQKEAVIAALNAEIKKSTISENASSDLKRNKVEDLKAVIESRPQKLANLLQFSNLASSFIEVESTTGEGEVSRSSNSLAAFTELSNSDPGSNRSPSDEGGINTNLFDSQEQVDLAIEKIKGSQDEGQASQDEDAANATLTVDQINENLLKY